MSLNEYLVRLLGVGGRILDLRNACADHAEAPWPSHYQVSSRQLDDGEWSALVADHDPPRDAPELPVSPDDAPYDAVCLRHYRLSVGSPINLFNSVYEALGASGYFLCSVRVDADLGGPAPEQAKLALLTAIAGRCGLSVVDPGSLPCMAEQGQCLLVFRKEATPPRWRLGHMDRVGLEEVATLFRDSFNTEVNIDLWRWKYGAGRGRAIVARRGARLVAHYGSILRALSYFGEPGTAVEICDVMVDPRERGVMTKTGAMLMTTATYFELYLGLQGFTMTFGFPTRRHMQLGEKLGLYGEIDRILEVRWAGPTEMPEPGIDLQTITAEAMGWRHRVDALWARMREDLRDAVVVIRDWDYLTYRYLRHPTIRYEVLCVSCQSAGEPLGIMVLRQDAGHCELVDLVAPLEHLQRMIEQARRVAAHQGCETLYCWTTEQRAEAFAGATGTITPLDISIATSVWLPGQSVESLEHRMWLMSGDTDFR